MHSAFSWKRPTAIRYPNQTTEGREGEEVCRRELGKGEVLARGDDVLVIALGHQCTAALRLRELLQEEGIGVTVVDPVFVKPLDIALLGGLLLEHNRIVTIEEHSLKGGLGAEVNEFLVSHGFGGIEVLNFGVPERYVEQGGYGDLLEEIGMTPELMRDRMLTHFSFKGKQGKLAQVQS